MRESLNMNLQKRKIAITGAGHVGSHAGCSLISRGLAQEIVYIDVDRKMAAGSLPDMGQTRMDTLRQTIAVMKDVTETIRMSGFAGIILNISNPAEEQEQFNASCKTMNENYQLSLT